VIPAFVIVCVTIALISWWCLNRFLNELQAPKKSSQPCSDPSHQLSKEELYLKHMEFDETKKVVLLNEERDKETSAKKDD
jgi:hypothetical protein